MGKYLSLSPLPVALFTCFISLLGHSYPLSSFLSPTHFQSQCWLLQLNADNAEWKEREEKKWKWNEKIMISVVDDAINFHGVRKSFFRILNAGDQQTKR